MVDEVVRLAAEFIRAGPANLCARADRIAESTGDPLVLAEHAFERLEAAERVKVTDLLCGSNRVASVSHLLRRWLAGE